MTKKGKKFIVMNETEILINDIIMMLYSMGANKNVIENMVLRLARITRCRYENQKR